MLGLPHRRGAFPKCIFGLFFPDLNRLPVDQSFPDVSMIGDDTFGGPHRKAISAGPADLHYAQLFRKLNESHIACFHSIRIVVFITNRHVSVQKISVLRILRTVRIHHKIRAHIIGNLQSLRVFPIRHLHPIRSVSEFGGF